MDELQQTYQIYVDGWNAGMKGEDGRYTNPHKPPSMPDFRDPHVVWCTGFLDAMEAEDGEQPQPETAGL